MTGPSFCLAPLPPVRRPWVRPAHSAHWARCRVRQACRRRDQSRRVRSRDPRPESARPAPRPGSGSCRASGKVVRVPVRSVLACSSAHIHARGTRVSDASRRQRPDGDRVASKTKWPLTRRRRPCGVAGTRLPLASHVASRPLHARHDLVDLGLPHHRRPRGHARRHRHVHPADPGRRQRGPAPCRRCRLSREPDSTRRAGERRLQACGTGNR